MNFQIAQMVREYPMHYYGNDENGWLSLAWFLLITAIVVAAIVLIAKYVSKAAAGHTPKDPLEIAKERYAKGEITKEELTEIKKELRTKD